MTPCGLHICSPTGVISAEQHRPSRTGKHGLPFVGPGWKGGGPRHLSSPSPDQRGRQGRKEFLSHIFKVMSKEDLFFFFFGIGGVMCKLTLSASVDRLPATSVFLRIFKFKLLPMLIEVLFAHEFVFRQRPANLCRARRALFPLEVSSIPYRSRTLTLL